MSKILYITSNPKSVEQSYSLTVGEAFLEEYKKLNPNDEIINLDLYKTYVPYIDEDVFNAWGKLSQGTDFNSLSEEEKKKVSGIDKLTDQFIDADKYVFVTPLWNFGFPPIMKAYIDTICIAKKTFKYTENGPVGLLHGRKALHIQASGSVFSEGDYSQFEHGNSHMKTILNFVGITDIETILVEGIAQMPDKAEEIKNNSILKAKEVASRF
ncbi:FMN-dependent NADH-azoreductase [Gottschalkia purinilytica]|nr:FMN-dependent NADH-azoreductase [Gottschalkia purinilytica]